MCDSLCGALYDAVEYRWGTIEDGHLLALQDKLYRRKGRLWGYGLKIQPYKLAEIPSNLINLYPWMGKI
ncbi:MAG: hypothetical protein GEU28_10900 [Dehalococcoidia bacterium]|nr:hypothetical protein [Dehalococcoidia bacterium]